MTPQDPARIESVLSAAGAEEVGLVSGNRPPGPPRHVHANGTTCMWVRRSGIDRWRRVDATGWDQGACPGPVNKCRVTGCGHQVETNIVAPDTDAGAQIVGVCRAHATAIEATP